MTDVDPNGNLSVMAKINLSEQKNLPLAVLNKTDTFILKFWIKGNNRTISVFSGVNKIQEVRAIAEWTECTIKFEANYGDLLFLLLPAGTYYIWHDKLENGTIASDYDKNQADSEKYLSQELVSMSSKINQRLDVIDLTVSKQITKTDNLGTRMTNAESSISMMADDIKLKVSSNDFNGAKLVSLINMTPENIRISAEHINLSGKVTITGSNSMLDKESKDYLTNISDTVINANETASSASNTANSANSNASTALSKANDASDIANKAKESADNTSSMMKKWQYHDKTTIDGNVIETGTVTADKINVADLYALEAKIGNFDIGQNSIYNGTDSINSNSNGVYVGIDGIRNVSGANTVTIKDGTLYANNANITGGSITGTTIDLLSSDEETAKITVKFKDTSSYWYTSTIAPGAIKSNKVEANTHIKVGVSSQSSGPLYADANHFTSTVNYVILGNATTGNVKLQGSVLNMDCNKIGFFGKTPLTKTLVSNKTYLSSVTAQSVGNDLNALKTALRNYGLIA